MTFLLDAPVSRYRWPLKIRDFVWQIKYWDLLLPSWDKVKAGHFDLAESQTSRNKNWTICGGLWGTSGFCSVPVTAVAFTN